MKKFIGLLFAVLAIGLVKGEALAEVGDMGFFGGITEGSRLPTTIEQALAATAKKAQNRNITNQAYKEFVFVSGRAVEISGLLTVKQTGDVVDTADLGTYKVAYTLTRVNAAATDYITRNVTFNVSWRRVGKQIVKDYAAAAWTETITLGGVQYVLDKNLSYYNISFLEDHQPAVTYVKGDLSMRATYLTGGTDTTVYEAYGTISGYMSPWSSTETMRIDGQIMRDDWQMSFQTRPSVSVFKTLQYSKNEPQIISFDGNYREVTQNKSGLAYDIFNLPIDAPEDTPLEGLASIEIHSTFEQLPTVDLSSLKANPAAADIHKLFSMGILDVPVSQFVPSQLIRRGDFFTMLAKAVKLPVEPVASANARNRKGAVVEFTFPDVLPTRPDYPYIMAVYKAGIAGGRGNGMFYPDYAITREEAVTSIINALGLNNLGIEPTNVTQFADDKDISDWAKKAVYAARRIGLITGDENGKLNPKQSVPKAEVAALINGIIEYMRTTLQTDYAEHIVNTVN